ncbi:hypothetical protein [Methylopila sp. Yamaguchi]|uniref:hypothetical protein n=1 Tax=Methylopila sp. Yamaguchi TaxID=1437817 RepID=UPI000CB003F4|nr:hypothetical protein [Methylopila sp. Yamaguchi]GBD50249.1 hypothetical protein METY_3462 [Methylopila sp. Yamaguchi]
MSAVLTKSDFAKHLDVGRARVSQLIKRGMPVTPDGRIDVEAANSWIRANVRHRFDVRRASTSGAGRNPMPAAPVGDLADAKLNLILAQTARTAAEAERAEVALELERGSAISKEDAKRFVREWNTKIKIGLLNFASRRGPGLAAELGVNEVALVVALEVAMREHMTEMADEPLPMDAGEPVR